MKLFHLLGIISKSFLYCLNLLYIMITNVEKCHHVFEYIMASRVCKRCGYMERLKSPVYA